MQTENELKAQPRCHISVTEPSAQLRNEDTCSKWFFPGDIHCQGEDDTQARVFLPLPNLSVADESSLSSSLKRELLNKQSYQTILVPKDIPDTQTQAGSPGNLRNLRRKNRLAK